MAFFGGRKSKQGDATDLALAYLEEAQRIRTSLTLLTSKGRETPAVLGMVSDERVVLTLQGPLIAERGEKLSLLLHMDGLRFKVTTSLAEAKPGQAVLETPEGIQLVERRKKARARLNPREGATVTALTGLFDGVGVSGPIENISEGGLRMRIDRALDVKTQRRLPMGTSLLAPGQSLMLVKLSKLPKCPVLELTGTVVYLDADRDGLSLGLAFEPGKDSLLGPVRQLVTSRAGTIPTQVPPKTRRSQEEPPAEPQGSAIELASARGPARPVADPEPVPEAAVPSPVPAPAEAKPAVEPSPAPAPEVSERSQALLRVKKRSRTVLLAMPAGLDRHRLSLFLANEGYGRVLTATTLTELLEHLEGPGEVHLVLIDGGVVELAGLELASLIHHRFEGTPPPILLAESHVDAELVLGSREAGVAHILVKPYEADAELAHLLEAQLGLS